MSEAQPRSLLAVAIERRDWELAALCLLVGATLQARRMPSGTVDDLIAELGGEPRQHHREHRRRSHGRRR